MTSEKCGRDRDERVEEGNGRKDAFPKLLFHRGSGSSTQGAERSLPPGDGVWGTGSLKVGVGRRGPWMPVEPVSSPDPALPLPCHWGCRVPTSWALLLLQKRLDLQRTQLLSLLLS